MDNRCKPKSELWKRRMREMHADPEFKARLKARRLGILSTLSPKQREDYDILRKKGGYSREEALSIVLPTSTTI